MTYQEASRVTPAQFAVYQKAFEIERQEFEYRSAVSAWFNQASKATRKNGKSAYKDFNAFYDQAKHFATVFERDKPKPKRISLADLNRMTNRKEV